MKRRYLGQVYQRDRKSSIGRYNLDEGADDYATIREMTRAIIGVRTYAPGSRSKGAENE